MKLLSTLITVPLLLSTFLFSSTAFASWFVIYQDAGWIGDNYTVAFEFGAGGGWNFDPRYGTCKDFDLPPVWQNRASSARWSSDHSGNILFWTPTWYKAWDYTTTWYPTNFELDYINDQVIRVRVCY
ncbi:hypothetical protein GQ42DRAFT_165054 [Ramicandelaber brevisporus]|nr:hypothetical protein GQ42DRAFT_165054 [Ramicandelaber brevisporus]